MKLTTIDKGTSECDEAHASSSCIESAQKRVSWGKDIDDDDDEFGLVFVTLMTCGHDEAYAISASSSCIESARESW